MASFVYDKARELAAGAGINWTSSNIKAVLVDTGAYTPNSATDQYLSSIASGARIATSGNLANKTATAGACDADDISITGVSGATVEAVVVYIDTGTASTSPLLAFLDNITVNGGSPPLTPNGGQVDISWDNGTNKIFRV
jgi:hypothetical protein